MEETNTVDAAGGVPLAFNSENMDRWIDIATTIGLNLLLALIIIGIGAWISKIIRKGIQRALSARNLEPTIISFVGNVVYIAIMAFVILAALERVGFKTTGFAAVIAAAGLAIGLALQGSLSNFAAGFLIILFRPFKKGDYVEAAGTAGIVEEIHIFTSVFRTPDNKKIIIPNSKITADNITNYSAMATRRVDWVFGVSYEDDIDKVKAAIRKVIEGDERIHKEPAPAIVLSAMADSSVNFTTRGWVDAPNYWPVFFDVNEKIKKTFDAEGITIPFPQRDVHLYQQQ